MSCPRRSNMTREQGSVLLSSLFLLVVMSLLGIAIFSLATIEVSQAKGTRDDLQAFYCADAQASRIYSLYWDDSTLAPPQAPDYIVKGQPTRGIVTVSLPNGQQRQYPYIVAVDVVQNPGTQSVKVTATCGLPDWSTQVDWTVWPTRTVQRNGTRTTLSPPFDYVAVLAGFNPVTRTQQYLGNFFLGGMDCDPVVAGTTNCRNDGTFRISAGGNTYNYVGGGDRVNGDSYVSGTAYLRDGTTLTGYSPTDDRATITTNPDACPSLGGKCVQAGNSSFDKTAPGAVAASNLNPMPCLVSPCSNPSQNPIIDDIAAAVAGKWSAPYAGTTVYNLSEIYKLLGTNWSDSPIPTLNRPDDCHFGQSSSSQACQAWQAVALLGIRKTCDSSDGTPCPTTGVQSKGPKDKPTYYFLGIGANGNGTSGGSWGAAAVGSPELTQMGFTVDSGNCSAGSICDRLTTLFGSNFASRLVDFTMTTGPNGAVSRATPPIFYVDGYWRAYDPGSGTSGVVYNGVATIVASKSMIINSNLVSLNSQVNANLTVPTCSPSPCNKNDRDHSGLGDMLALIAKEDIWMGNYGSEPGQLSALMLAGRDFNYFDYTSSGACCVGPSIPTILNGSAMASRQIAMIRDWAAIDPPNGGGPNTACNSAGPGSGCKPVAFFPTVDMARAAGFTGSWCSNPNYNPMIPGCWVFMTLDATTGILTADNTQAAFNEGCVTVGYDSNGDPQFKNQTGALMTGNCPVDSRRVTHFQLKLNYDARLKTTPALIPPGLPISGGTIYPPLTLARWKDCGPKADCS